MIPRACPSCGVLEERSTVNGREQVNLNPFTNECLDCTIQTARELTKRQHPPKFDPKLAAAGDRE